MNLRAVGVAACLCLLAACSRSAEQRRLLELKGTPDVVTKAAEKGSSSRAFSLQAFQVNQIWGGDGHQPTGGAGAGGNDFAYRAKITLWDNDPKESAGALAEIFFRDSEPADRKSPLSNPDPTKSDAGGARRPYQLFFPSSELNNILQTLRFANSEVYLFYHDKQWAIGTELSEIIGSN